MEQLIDRIEQLNRTIELLTHDVELLTPSLGDRSIAALPTPDEYSCRRSYVRATFALFEALTHQYARLLVDLADRGMLTLETGVRAALSEQTYEVTDSGRVRQRPAWLTLERKVRLVCSASEALGQPLSVRYDDGGWAAFKTAQDIRHAITHPKSPNDCDIEGEHLGTVDAAGAWFGMFHNEFVRVVREHRASHGW